MFSKQSDLSEDQGEVPNSDEIIMIRELIFSKEHALDQCMFSPSDECLELL